MRGGWFRLGLALPALLIWWGAACESVVNGQLGDVHCLDEDAVGPPACPTGFACRSGLCTPSLIGALCATDADCAPVEFCLDPTDFHGTGPRRCSHTCCTSADCDPDPASVCWVPPIGVGSFCRHAADIGRPSGGTLGPLAPCAADDACRSGRCVDQRCADACCTDTPCAPGGVCRADGPPRLDGPGFACGPAPGELPRYALCDTDADCASGLCLDFHDKQPRCSGPCCSSEDCEGLPGGPPVQCVMLTGTHLGLRACLTDILLTKVTGPGGVGVACSDPTDCRGGMCLELGGRWQCTDLCCTDGSCGESPSMVCRPAIVDNGWALQCAPK